MIIVTTQDANPFYDDSYAVNSANLGPYGDAIVQELNPYFEKKFRAIGEPWARVLYGGSAGGWEAMAQQVFHPDYYNGAWISCPDPIDFHVLRTLLIDRFCIMFHQETKSLPAHGLVVDKKGPKLEKGNPDKHSMGSGRGNADGHWLYLG